MKPASERFGSAGITTPARALTAWDCPLAHADRDPMDGGRPFSIPDRHFSSGDRALPDKGCARSATDCLPSVADRAVRVGGHALSMPGRSQDFLVAVPPS